MLDFDFGFFFVFFFDVLDAPKPAACSVLETGGICGTGSGRINALAVVVQSSSRAKVEDIIISEECCEEGEDRGEESGEREICLYYSCRRGVAGGNPMVMRCMSFVLAPKRSNSGGKRFDKAVRWSASDE